MKILAGSLRGRGLILPKGLKSRPTSARMRAQVFNICQHVVEGAHFLDIFAGTGAMGFEAISRGAVSCTFIENDKLALRGLYTNIKQFNLEQSCHVIGSDALKVVSKLKTSFSIIYIDPPYAFDKQALADFLVSLDQHLAVEEGAYLFLETRKNTFSLPPLTTFCSSECRRAGDSDLYILKSNLPPIDRLHLR